MSENEDRPGPDRTPGDGIPLRVTLAYDGTDFHGWQIQPGGLRTIQGELVRCLRRLVDLDGLPPGAGRTDTGVHARGQVTSFTVPDETARARVERALPRMLPPDVAVREIALAEPGFHARFSATGRRYRYAFTTAADPFRRRQSLKVPRDLDLDAMSRALRALEGDHDCTSLCRTSSVEPGRTLCRIRVARLCWEGDSGWLELQADRFLHSMVRIVVGTLLEVGRGRRGVDTFSELLPARDRRLAGPTAPAHGLCLEEVFYDGPPGGDPEN